MKIAPRRYLAAVLLIMSAVPAVCAAETGLPRRGTFTVTATLEQLVGDEAIEMGQIIARHEQIDWEVFVPEQYSPKSPAGLMVYVSPGSSGELPSGWDQVLEDRNLIWVSANKSGNNVPVASRMLKAIYGLEAIRQQYAIDDSRIYVAGFSGGGKVAGRIAENFATTFAGGLFICGVDPLEGGESENIGNIRSNRYVFLTGEFDQALEPTKRVYRKYRAAAIPNIKLMVIRGMGHRNPPSHEFRKAIDFLDTHPNETG